MKNRFVLILPEQMDVEEVKREFRIVDGTKRSLIKSYMLSSMAIPSDDETEDRIAEEATDIICNSMKYYIL